MEPIEIRSDSRRRLLAASPSEVFAAMSDPTRVARWWGPTGFTNTIQQFEFKPGGTWLLTMHGPDGKDYPNESRFTRIVDDQVFEIEHLNGHHFFLTIELAPIHGGTEVTWRQTFDTREHYERIAEFVASANEQNLDRLAAEVQNGKSAAYHSYMDSPPTAVRVSRTLTEMPSGDSIRVWFPEMLDELQKQWSRALSWEACADHQQPGRAGAAHGEGEAKDIGLL